MKKIIFNENETKDILDKYLNQRLSMAKIGKDYNCSKTVIARILKENNIDTSKRDNHKYYADYDKFHIIDSPEKAYWLGFIAADGCNYEREGNASILINIHQKDANHLEKYKIFMNTNAEIKYIIQQEGFSNSTPMCRLVLNSKQMSQDLSRLGVVPRKSLILKPPIIDEKYYLPFILGYFDGDGSISHLANGEFSLSIQGTKEILEWINDICHISKKLEKRSPNNTNNYYIRCGGTNKPYNILKKLYNSVDVHLDRKYNIFKTLETVVLSRNTK